MSDDDSLVATRARRSNAGSRLKHLIELEERASEAQESATAIINDEDENVNLLFQEDEDDQEFFQEENDEENDEVSEAEGDDAENVDEEDGVKKRLHDSDEEVEQVNSDDVLSDSDISMSESDESEGEKELQKQERMKERKIKKKQGIVPAIKKPKLSDTPKVKKPKGLTTSDSLMLSIRRSSSRATAVENKEALVQKLKEHERKRASVAPIVRVKHVDLTQEEKLAEAIETEKANIISLQQFRDQEIVKKERQKQLLLLRKVHLRNVIRIVSSEKLITPLDEVNEARHVQGLIASRSKKKLGRKKKISKELEARRLPGEVDTELPFVKQELERKRIQEEMESEANLQDEKALEPADSKDSIDLENKESRGDTTNPSELQDTSEITTSVNTETSNDEKVGPKLSGTEDNTILSPDLESKTSIEKTNNGENIEEAKENSSIVTEEIKTDIPSSEDSGPVLDTLENELTSNDEPVTVKNENIDMAFSDNEALIGHAKDNNDKMDSGDEKDLPSPKIDRAEEAKEEKRVKFADEVQEQEAQPEESELNESHLTPDIESDSAIEPNSEIFEGPPQRVARNIIYLIDFEEDKDAKYKLDNSNVKSILLGPQSLLPASRRFKDLKTILRIGEVENPYAAVKEEKDELFESALELDEENAMFDELKRLPKLGITQAIVEEIEEDTQEENAAIVLKTEAPSGIYLPNGNKKVCFISGTEVKYFDPSNGIPYSNVETYRFLKTIEQGNAPWYSIGEADNDYGPVELYLGSRDGTERHAKGVPEGFEG